MKYERLSNISNENLSMVESALLSYYKLSNPGHYRSGIKTREARNILKSVLGIRHTNDLTDDDINDIIIDAESNLLHTSRIKMMQGRDMYRTA